jgi:hypothetical protein
VAHGRYRVIEPTFDVEGGTPVDALEHVLNEPGHHFVGATRVREPGGEWVDVIILERDTL